MALRLLTNGLQVGQLSAAEAEREGLSLLEQISPWFDPRFILPEQRLKLERISYLPAAVRFRVGFPGTGSKAEYTLALLREILARALERREIYLMLHRLAEVWPYLSLFEIVELQSYSILPEQKHFKADFTPPTILEEQRRFKAHLDAILNAGQARQAQEIPHTLPEVTASPEEIRLKSQAILRDVIQLSRDYERFLTPYQKWWLTFLSFAPVEARFRLGFPGEGITGQIVLNSLQDIHRDYFARRELWLNLHRLAEVWQYLPPEVQTELQAITDLPEGREYLEPPPFDKAAQNALYTWQVEQILAARALRDSSQLQEAAPMPTTERVMFGAEAEAIEQQLQTMPEVTVLEPAAPAGFLYIPYRELEAGIEAQGVTVGASIMKLIEVEETPVIQAIKNMDIDPYTLQPSANGDGFFYRKYSDTTGPTLLELKARTILQEQNLPYLSRDMFLYLYRLNRRPGWRMWEADPIAVREAGGTLAVYNAVNSILEQILQSISIGRFATYSAYQQIYGVPFKPEENAAEIELMQAYAEEQAAILSDTSLTSAEQQQRQLELQQALIENRANISRPPELAPEQIEAELISLPPPLPIEEILAAEQTEINIAAELAEMEAATIEPEPAIIEPAADIIEEAIIGPPLELEPIPEEEFPAELFAAPAAEPTPEARPIFKEPAVVAAALTAGVGLIVALARILKR